MALLRRSLGRTRSLSQRNSPGFQPFPKLFVFFSKSFLTILGVRTYTTAIDGVAADFAADADASPFEPKRFGWLGEPGGN
jgi:hypothetical protein